MNHKNQTLYLSMSMLILSAACGDELVLDLGSSYLRSELISAEAGGGFMVSETDAADFAGLGIEVPARALAQDTTVTVLPSDDLAAADAVEWVGPAVEFGPAGLQFSSDATLTLHVDRALAEGEVPTVRMVSADGSAEWVAAESIVVNAEGTWSFPVSHFTKFQPGRRLQAQVAPASTQAEVLGGTTSVLLDLAALSANGLDVSGFSDEVLAPGSLGPNSVAFPINPSTSTSPTTFVYETTTFAPVSGTIEHEGLIYFDQQFASGNFSIGFDAVRATGAKSGFFVESTVEGFLLIGEIFFDVAAPTSVSATSTSLTIEADLLVSPELANFLNRPALAGADVGDALISATAQAR